MGSGLIENGFRNISLDKSVVIDEVTRRVTARQLERGRTQPGFSLEILINEAVTQERERLAGSRGNSQTRAQRRFWERVTRDFPRVSEGEREEILARIIRFYVDEIYGTFNPRLHNLAARILSWVLKLLMSRFSPVSILAGLGNRLNLEENLILTGPMDTLRRLTKRGTLILVPTHVSNLDSVVIGLGLYRSRLPPFTYGAGLNLFANPVLAYFMNRLGAYKVDRRKQNAIYKDTLKAYATLSLEHGQHQLFFPGGTRNRRGDIERHLKLGLLGCGLSAYLANLQAANEKPDLFVVPATLSYGLVLEAQSLVEDHLKETGKNRFIRIRNDLSRPLRLLRFWRNLQSLHSQIHLRFGEPLDLFGNAVDENGISRDGNGRPIDRRKYVEVGHKPRELPQRDQEYTRELGRAIGKAYLRDNTALCTHAVAFAVFTGLRSLRSELDFYRFLRQTGSETFLPLSVALNRLDHLLVALRECETKQGIRLEDPLREKSAQEVFDTAMSHFRSYHDQEVLRCESACVYSLNLKLLYYYHNRLDHYGLPT